LSEKEKETPDADNRKEYSWKELLLMILSAYRILIPILLFIVLAAFAAGWGFLALFK